MNSALPTITVQLWRADAVVLFDWLMSTDLDTVPVTHPAQKQALADLLSALEWRVDADMAASHYASPSREDEISGAHADRTACGRTRSCHRSTSSAPST